MRYVLPPVFCLAALCLGNTPAGAQPISPAAPKPPTTPVAAKPAPSPLSTHAVSTDLDAILRALTDSGDYSAAIARAQTVFDRLVAYGDPNRDIGAFCLADRWLRLFRHLEGIPEDQRGAALKTLRTHNRLAATLAHVVRPKYDNLPKVYEFINRLAERRERTLDRFAELAAAVAVVHDAPLAYERALAPDALEIYDYFAAIDGSATLAPSNLPAELLIYVVDTTAKADELWWGLNRYPGDRQPGRHFFEIQYDNDNFKRGKPLKLDKYDFTLQNIRKIGGVCRHQAYYAAQVSKAVGIPSVVDSARGADTGHAWVGYLDITGPTPRWDFDDGRYKEYKGLMGNVPDPQTRRVVPDSQVALTAQFLGEPAESRMLAAALTDAAARLADFSSGGTPTVKERPDSTKPPTSPGATPPSTPASTSPPLSGPTVTTPTRAPGAGTPAAVRPPTPAYPPAIDWAGGPPRTPRAADIPARLALLEEAVNASPASQDAWLAVADLATNQQLDHEQLVRWSEAAASFCGTAYPDFALDVLKPMFKSVKDPAEQERLWDWAYGRFFKGVSDQSRRRIDLAAMIRFEQGRLWEEHNQPARAWDRYKQVIVEFPNDGPFVVTAVDRCAKMLKKADKPIDDLIALYQDAWRRIKKPGEMSGEFASQSNWSRVGNAYETILRNAGRTNEADRVRAQFRPDKDEGG